jgi:hypothetical protein
VDWVQKQLFVVCFIAVFLSVILTGCEVVPTVPEEEEWITVTATASAYGNYYYLQNLDPKTDLVDPFDYKGSYRAPITSGNVIFSFSVGGGTSQTLVSTITDQYGTDGVAITVKVWKDQDIVVTATLEGNPINAYPWWAQYGGDSYTFTWAEMFKAAGDRFESDCSVGTALTVSAPRPGSWLPPS